MVVNIKIGEILSLKKVSPGTGENVCLTSK